MKEGSVLYWDASAVISTLVPDVHSMSVYCSCGFILFKDLYKRINSRPIQLLKAWPSVPHVNVKVLVKKYGIIINKLSILNL